MLKGTRCNVRHITAAELDNYIALINDLESRGPWFSYGFKSPSEARREFAANGMITEERENYVVVDKDDQIIGAISHFKGRTPICREIGYRLLDRRYDGRGVMSEATQLVRDYVFLSSMVNRVELLMDPENIASERIAQKNGFTYEGTMRGAFFSQGVIRDTKVYSQLRHEWEAQRVTEKADL